MKLRKFFALLLCLILVLGLAACGDNGDPAPADGGGDAAPAGDGGGSGESGGELKVALLITSNLGDRGFYDSAGNGITLIQQELGATVNVIEMGQDPSKYEPYIRDVAEQDWDYVIVGSSPAIEVMEQLVPEYPDQKFMMFDTELAGSYDNLYCVTYKQNEGSFLAGAVAAIVTTQGEKANPEKIIGCIAGGDNPIINDFILGYIRGAQYVEPDIQVAIAYAGTFVDSTKGKELALAMMGQQGVDICYQIASQTGIGVLDAARELDLYAIGVDGDQEAAFRDTDPGMSDVIVTSMMKRVDQSLLRAVQMAEAGTLPWGTTEVVGLEELGVGIVYDGNFTGVLSAESQALVREIEQKIINGEIVVESAFDITAEAFQAICDEVNPN